MVSRQQRRAALRRVEALDMEAHVARVARELRRRATFGVFDGRETPEAGRYIASCRVVDIKTGALLIFTRDAGMHASGWFKNPDYDRCEHLSISPLNAAGGLVDERGVPVAAPDLDRILVERWVRAFYGDRMHAVWAESPKSAAGRRHGVWHWRVFCDAAWSPIVPCGEVYDLDRTELGWRSASEVIDLTDAGGMTT